MSELPSNYPPESPGRRYTLGTLADDHLATRVLMIPHEGSVILEHLLIYMEDTRPGIFKMTSVRVGENGDSMWIMGPRGANWPLAGRDASELSNKDDPLSISGASYPVDAETPLIFQWEMGPRQTEERFHAMVWGTIYPTRQEAIDEMKRRDLYPGSEKLQLPG